MRDFVFRKSCLLAIALGLIQLPLIATNYTWNEAGDGPWTLSSNWTSTSPQSYPQTFEDTAIFPAFSGTPSIEVSLGNTTSIDVLSLLFTAGSTTSYTINGPNINLNVDTTDPSIPPIINVANGGSATIQCRFNENGGNVIKTGGGDLTIQFEYDEDIRSNFYVDEGSLSILNSGYAASVFNINPGATGKIQGSVLTHVPVTVSGTFNIIDSTIINDPLVVESGGVAKLSISASGRGYVNDVTLNGTGILDISGSAVDQTFLNLSTAAGSSVILGSRSLTLENNGTLAGSMTGTGYLNLQGAIWTITGTNTLGGLTLENETTATLTNTNTIGTGGVSIEQNSILNFSSSGALGVNQIYMDGTGVLIAIGGTQSTPVTLTLTNPFLFDSSRGQQNIVKTDDYTTLYLNGNITNYRDAYFGGNVHVGSDSYGTTKLGRFLIGTGRTPAHFTLDDGATIGPIHLPLSASTGNVSIGSTPAVIGALSGVSHSNWYLGRHTIAFCRDVLGQQWYGNIKKAPVHTADPYLHFRADGGTPHISLFGENDLDEIIIEENVTVSGPPKSLVGKILNDGDVSFYMTSDGVKSDDILNYIASPPKGILDKGGSYALTLTGTISQKLIDVWQGSLKLFGNTVTTSNATPGVLVEHGTALMGNPQINTTELEVRGTLMPIGSAGELATLTVNGDTSFKNGSILAATIDKDVASKVVVSGTTTVDSPSKVRPLWRGYIIGQPVTIATFENLPGDFELLLPSSISAHLFYTPSSSYDLQIVLDAINLANVVSSGNPGQVAFYLDGQTSPSEDLAHVIMDLAYLPDDEMAAALNQLHPALFSAFALTQENLAIRSRTLYSERANELFYITCGCVCPAPFCQGVWLDIMGDDTVQQPDGDNYGYHEKGGYAYVGYDFFTSEHLNTGISFGYARNSIDWTDVQSHGNMNSYSLGLYGSDCFCNTLVDAALQFTWSDIESTRHIEFSDLDYNAKNDHGSWLWAAHLGLSQYYNCSYAAFVPFAYLDCVDVYEDSYTEHDADDLDLNVNRHHANMLRGELGLRLLDDFCYCGCRVIPSLSASVVQEWRYAGTVFTSQMVGAVGTFDVNGINPDRTLFAPGAEILVTGCEDHYTVTLRYDGEFGKKVNDNVATLKLSYNY